MDVYFCTTNKKINSTALIDYVQYGVKFECTLKDSCDILNPVLILNLSNDSRKALITNNYAVIEWGFKARYYFINDFTFKNSLIEVTLNEDYLASWKTEMLATTQYVLRSASSADSALTDNKYPLRATQPNVVVGRYAENDLQPASTAYGVYMVGVVNKVGSVAGCVEYYAMSYLVFMSFCQKLFYLPTQWGDGGQDIADGLKKAITDPFQYIVSCIWLPYSVNDFVNRGLADSAGSYNIYVGYDMITLSVKCYPLSNSILNVEFTNVITVTTPQHPQAATRGIYLNREPFTRYYLSFYPFCGLIDLDGSKLKGTTYFCYTVDLRTGKGILNICSDISGSSYADWKPSQIIRSIEAQIGVPIPIAAIQTALPNTLGEFLMNATIAGTAMYGGFGQMLNTLSSDLQGDVRGITGGAVPPAGTSAYKAYERAQAAGKVTTVESGNSSLMGDLAKIGTAALSMKSTLEMLGSQGTISLNSRNPFAFWALCYLQTDENRQLFGRPLCQSVVLNTLTGFTLCDSPKLAISNALQTEVATLENLLATGIFIE